MIWSEELRDLARMEQRTPQTIGVQGRGHPAPLRSGRVLEENLTEYAQPPQDTSLTLRSALFITSSFLLGLHLYPMELLEVELLSEFCWD